MGSFAAPPASPFCLRSLSMLNGILLTVVCTATTGFAVQWGWNLGETMPLSPESPVSMGILVGACAGCITVTAFFVSIKFHLKRLEEKFEELPCRKDGRRDCPAEDANE